MTTCSRPSHDSRAARDRGSPARSGLRAWTRTRLLAFGLTVALAMAGIVAVGSPYGDWTAWRAPEAGFSLWLPPSHDVGNSGRIWYVHGSIEGDPTVPDMSIQFHPDATLEAALEELSDDVLVEWVRLGDDTPARRLTARHEGIHGPYVSSWYLIPAPDGVFEIRGWENLYWELFHHVAVTFTIQPR